MTPSNHRAKPYGFAILFAVFFPPLLIVLHEAGHYTAARLLGYSPTFSYGEVTIYQPLGSTHQFIWTLAGPCVELLLCVFGVVGLIRLSRSSRTGSCAEVWLWSALAGSGIRWLKVPFDGDYGDEARMSVMLGFHHLFLPLILLIPSLALAVLLLRFHRQNHTLLPLAVSFAVGIISVFVWLTYLGPAVLPKPQRPSPQVSFCCDAHQSY